MCYPTPVGCVVVSRVSCAGYLDHPFLKNNTQQENSQAPWRRIGFTCLPVTLVVLAIIRRPSVPSDSLQLAPQQVSCIDNGFDLSSTSFPRICLSPDGSRLCPSLTESTPSVPPLSRSSTLQTRSGTLALQHSISRPRDTIFPTRQSSPFSPRFTASQCASYDRIYHESYVEATPHRMKKGLIRRIASTVC